MARRFLLPFFRVATRLFAGTLRCTAFARLWQFYACAASFRKSDGDGLFRVDRAVLPFANVVHLFADKFAGLGAGRFAFFFISVGSINSFLFRYDISPYHFAFVY
jgi:hypothetical protein